ncbi:MAG: hypothetical protein QM766_07895 [Burkholderiaceae bacterium]
MRGTAKPGGDLLDMFVVYFNNIHEAHYKYRCAQPAAGPQRESTKETS